MARYSSFSPEELVRACAQNGDRSAWEEFILRFRPVIATMVLRTAQLWCEPTPQLLDDLIQDTYSKLCANSCRLLRSFESRHEDAIFGFLKKVAASVVHDYFKAQKADRRSIDKTKSMSDCARTDIVESRLNHQDLDRNVVLQEIDRAVQRINGPESQRNRHIFWLHYRQGWTAGEIASLPHIGLTTKGVETTLRRMLLNLRSQLVDGEEKSSKVGT